MKLDLTIPPLRRRGGDGAAARLGLGDGLVLLGSSTWEGEEMMLVQALKAARSRGLKVSLLLVPRHAERRDVIVAALAKTGLRFHLRSHGAAPHEVDVAVGDTTGELRDFTQLADLVFCGKSLPPHDGGQSPIEATSLGKPLLFGPHMTNFREIARALRECGARPGGAQRKRARRRLRGTAGRRGAARPHGRGGARVARAEPRGGRAHAGGHPRAPGASRLSRRQACWR